MPQLPRRPTRRTVHKTFRLAPAELARLRRNAAATGLPVSTYVRHLALGRRVRARRRFVDGSAIAQLSRLGSNLQQLLRVAEGSGQAEALADLRRTYKALQKLMGVLLRIDIEADDSER